MKFFFVAYFLGTVLLNGVSANKPNCLAAKAISDSTHYIGEPYGGGLIFYLSNDGKHGLIAAPVAQITFVPWSNGKIKATGTTEEAGKVNGLENTKIIVNSLLQDNPDGKFAAKICADYSITVNGIVYDDWYLPSKKELDLLFRNCQKVDGHAGKWYFWCSNEINEDQAWLQNFYDGKQLNVYKSDENYVRAIRSF